MTHPPLPSRSCSNWKGLLRLLHDRHEKTDPRQLPLRAFVAPESLRWIRRHRAWTPFYLVRYWRFLRLRLRHPDVVTEGFVFLGKRVEIETRNGYGRIVLGRWVHLGDDNRIRAHEGTLRIGDKSVFGRDNTLNCYLDVEFGPRCIVADSVYVCDFDHRFDDANRPIKDQGIVKSPVRIGADVWVGVKASVLRGAQIGAGSVLAAHTVVRGEIPPGSVVAGVPGRVVRSRADGDVSGAQEAVVLGGETARGAAIVRRAAKSAPRTPPIS
jgi:acetyltransferase-like isoleucine patch superfamily enzyme